MRLKGDEDFRKDKNHRIPLFFYSSAFTVRFTLFFKQLTKNSKKKVLKVLLCHLFLFQRVRFPF